VFGSIQPDPLRHYLSYAALNADGFFPRFQLAVYPDPVPPRREIPPPPSVAAREAVRMLFRRLDAQPFNLTRTDDRYGPYIVLAPDAQQAFNDWRYDLEIRAQAETTDDVLNSYLTKYNSLALSLALIFHLAESKPNDNVQVVSMRAMDMAFKWTEYLERHLDRILQSRLTTTKGLTIARRIIPRLQSGDLGSGFTVRDLVRNGWAGLRLPGDVEAGVKVLTDLGWVRPRDTKGGFGKGRPTTVYDVNPKARTTNINVMPIDGEEGA